jgi:hypothetical protein
MKDEMDAIQLERMFYGKKEKKLLGAMKKQFYSKWSKTTIKKCPNFIATQLSFFKGIFIKQK